MNFYCSSIDMNWLKCVSSFFFVFVSKLCKKKKRRRFRIVDTKLEIRLRSHCGEYKERAEKINRKHCDFETIWKLRFHLNFIRWFLLFFMFLVWRLFFIKKWEFKIIWIMIGKIQTVIFVFIFLLISVDWVRFGFFCLYFLGAIWREAKQKGQTRKLSCVCVISSMALKLCN